MEFTKTEKVDLSTIAIRNTELSPLTVRITALEPGEQFVVAGVERESIESRMQLLRRDGRKFRTTKLGFNRYRVIRIA
jgi:hypothetical protein